MLETGYKNLIEAARERALSALPALLQRTVQDAAAMAAERRGPADGAAERSAQAAVRQLLLRDGMLLQQRVDQLYRSYLERALQTMYVDLRPGMREVTADELTLIDDDAVHHQIEVGRLVQRMRDASEEPLGRLNVIIGQLHGSSDARERENPFRPYPLARALYEACKTMQDSETVAARLFDTLSAAILDQLPAYYQAIREVFDALGVQGRFMAQRSQHPHRDGYARLHDTSGSGPAALARLAPELQRLLDSLRQTNPGLRSAAPPEIQQHIQAMFEGGSGSRPITRSAGQNPMLAELDRHQKLALQKSAGPAGREPDEQPDFSKAASAERLKLYAMSILCELIANDAALPDGLRPVLAKLRIPLMKAALLDPGLMRDENHPARRLVDRIGGLAAGGAGGNGIDARTAQEIEAAVDRLLADFKSDTSVFSDRLAILEDFIHASLTQGDDRAARAMELAERVAVLCQRPALQLRAALAPLNVDSRLAAFVIDTWPRILVQASRLDAGAGTQYDQPDSLYRQYRQALPELLWSVQPAQDADGRARLMRLLPDLVKRLRAAMAMIALPEQESGKVLDLLMQMHTAVLRGGDGKPQGPLLSLEEWQRKLAPISVRWQLLAPNQIERGGAAEALEMSKPVAVQREIVEAEFAAGGLSAGFHMDAGPAGVTEADRHFLARIFQPGVRVAFQGGGEGQLLHVSAGRSLYLFRHGDGRLSLYSVGALLAAANTGLLAPVDYPPLFERAIASLVAGAGDN